MSGYATMYGCRQNDCVRGIRTNLQTVTLDPDTYMISYVVFLRHGLRGHGEYARLGMILVCIS